MTYIEAVTFAVSFNNYIKETTNDKIEDHLFITYLDKDHWMELIDDLLKFPMIYSTNLSMTTSKLTIAGHHFVLDNNAKLL